MNARHRLIERVLDRDGEAMGAYLVMVTRPSGEFIELKVIHRDELVDHVAAGWKTLLQYTEEETK